jgi:hypothetical protein
MQRSFGLRLAAASPDGENCCRVSDVMSSIEPVSVPWNDAMLSVKCGRSVQTC